MQQITLTSRTCTQLESNSSLSFLSVHFRAFLTTQESFRIWPSPGLHSVRLLQPEDKLQPNAVLAGNTPLLPAGVPWLCPH